jgi:DNA-binding response OmpR family regulator
VLDMQMPVMDGRTFFRELRSHGDLTPVIVVSAAGARSAQRELHAEAALAKPFNLNDLVNQVSALVA